MKMTSEFARAFAIFLINERKRHMEDIRHIDRTLKALCAAFGFVLGELEKEAAQLPFIEAEDVEA